MFARMEVNRWLVVIQNARVNLGIKDSIVVKKVTVLNPILVLEQIYVYK